MIEHFDIVEAVARANQSSTPCLQYADYYAEGMLQLVLAYRGWNGKGSLVGHLHQRIQRRAVDYRRKVLRCHYKKTAPILIEYEDSRVEATQDDSVDHALRLERLNDGQREVFIRYMYGEYLREIGHSLGTTKNVIRYQLKKAKKRYAA